MARQIENESSLKAEIREKDTPKTKKIATAIIHAFRHIRHMPQTSYPLTYNVSETFKQNEGKAEQRKAEAIEYLHRTATTLC
jgi:hypothetical protein